MSDTQWTPATRYRHDAYNVWYSCEHCSDQHTNEFSRTCAACDFERESGDLDLGD